MVTQLQYYIKCFIKVPRKCVLNIQGFKNKTNDCQYLKNDSTRGFIGTNQILQDLSSKRAKQKYTNVYIQPVDWKNQK